MEYLIIALVTFGSLTYVMSFMTAAKLGYDCVADIAEGKKSSYPVSYFVALRMQLAIVSISSAIMGDMLMAITRGAVLVPVSYSLAAFKDDDGHLTWADREVRVSTYFMAATFAVGVLMIQVWTYAYVPSVIKSIAGVIGVASVIYYFFAGQVPTIRQKWTEYKQQGKRPPGALMQIARATGFGSFATANALAGNWAVVGMNAIPLVGALTLLAMYATWSNKK